MRLALALLVCVGCGDRTTTNPCDRKDEASLIACQRADLKKRGVDMGGPNCVAVVDHIESLADPDKRGDDDRARVARLCESFSREVKECVMKQTDAVGVVTCSKGGPDCEQVVAHVEKLATNDADYIQKHHAESVAACGAFSRAMKECAMDATTEDDLRKCKP